MPGGPTDDDGWGDAADEHEPSRPSVPAWDEDADEVAETEGQPDDQAADENREADLAASEARTEGPKPEASSALVVTGGAELGTKAPELEPAAAIDVGDRETKPVEADKKPPPDDSGWGGTLAEAAGIDPPKQKPPRPPLLSRRGWAWVLALVALAALLTTGGVLSHLNSQKLYLECGDDDVRAERGRWFPWGKTSLDGDRWKPFKLPGTCESREVDSESELEAAFLELLVSRLNTMLAAERPAEITEAVALIDQGMALARSPEHKPKRTELERLRGDVEYWRGRAELDGAIEKLETARGHYDEAVKIGPRHAGDAGDWTSFIERLIERARRGPTDEPEPGPTPRADAGPTAPPTDAAPPAVPIDIPDAGPPAATTPDAGVPRGGVLL